MTSRVCAITTEDNPFNPIKQFDEWHMYDIEKNYGTCELLDRLSNVSDVLSERENDEEIERAIDLIIELNNLIDPEISYKKVIEYIDDENFFNEASINRP